MTGAHRERSRRDSYPGASVSILAANRRKLSLRQLPPLILAVARRSDNVPNTGQPRAMIQRGHYVQI
jgi:hypothetical protein